MEIWKKVIITVSSITVGLAAAFVVLIIHTNYEIEHLNFSIKDDECE